MAVAAADFYTYARATGTPLPNSKKEEAQLAPAVDKWKKSRLNSNNQEEKGIDAGEAAGLTAALAGIGAGVVAARNPATRQRIAQILRPNVPVNEPEAVAKVVEQVTPKAGTGVSTDLGGITQDLNVDLSSTPPTSIAKTWVERRAVQTPKTATVVPKVTPQREVATVVPKVTEQPQVTSQQALDDYTQKWINENSTSKQNISGIQEGLRQEKLASGDKEISRGYFESDAKRQQEQIANRGFNETDLPELPDQPAPGAPLADDSASYNRKYIESTGSVAPKTQNIVSSPTQLSKEQLTELNTYADSVIDYDGDKDFIRIQDKLEAYLGGRTDLYPLTQQDLQKFDNSFTNLKRTDPTAMDHELDVLHSEVGVKLGRKPTEYTDRDIDLEDKRLYEVNVEGSSNIQQPGIFSDDPELNPKGYKYSSEEGVTQVTPAKEQTFLAEQIQSQPAVVVEKVAPQPVTLTDVAKTDDLVVSQQSIENSNLNLNANANTGVQLGLDPEVSKVASSPIKIAGTATPVPIVPSQQVYTTPTRTEGFYTRPQNLSSEARQGALSQLSVDNTGSQYPAGGTFLREYTTLGSKIAGDSNIQRGTVPQGQLELPIVYSTRGRTNPTLRTQLVNESPTYTSVDEYLARYEPVPTSDVQLGPSSAFLTDEQLDLETKRLRAIGELGQREEQLIESGLRPGTTRFDNARALGWTSKQYTPISITNRQFQEKASMPKSLREVLGEQPGRVFYETNNEGQIIPETVQIRGERPEVMKYPTGKGGGGRKVAEAVSPPDNPLDTLIVQKQVMPTGAQTRPVQDAIDNTGKKFGNLVDTKGLDLSSPIYANADQTGRVIGPYGIENTSALNPNLQNRSQAITSISPSASPGSWTPAAGRARSENVNVVISGGRDYTNYPEFVQKTDQVIREMNIPANKKITIVEGGAKGADKLAERYARERGYGLVVKPADWSKGGTLKYPKYDKSAGPIRNREMAEMGDVGIAFPGGKGTSNFVRTMAREKGKPVYYASEIQQATPEGKRAMAASEEIRKIYSSGRPDAQQQVANYIQQLRQKGI